MINTNKFLRYLKYNYKEIIYRVLIYILGLFLYGISVELYVNTKVGASQFDVAIFAFLAIANKGNSGLNDPSNNYALNPHILEKQYEWGVFYCFLILFAIFGFFRLYRAIGIWRITYDKDQMIVMLVDYLINLLPAVLWPLSIELAGTFIDIDKIGQLAEFWRVWIFMLSFLISCVSLALMVYSNLLYGPYNGLSTEINLNLKISYQTSRVIVDSMITVVGVVAILAATYFDKHEKFNFFANYLAFGTVLRTFFAGPIVAKMVKKLNKWRPIKSEIKH